MIFIEIRDNNLKERIYLGKPFFKSKYPGKFLENGML